MNREERIARYDVVASAIHTLTRACIHLRTSRDMDRGTTVIERAAELEAREILIACADALMNEAEQLLCGNHN